MRAMGPGSVSSLLKTALDVVYYILFAVVVVLLAAAVAVLFLPDPERVVAGGDGEMVTQIKLTGPILSGGLVAFALYCGVLLMVVSRVRSVFTTLIVGDPFHPDNIKRLRLIGLGLATLQGLNIVVRLVISWQLPGALPRGGSWFDLTGWFAVLVVFVLAEVFREGARLRREAELTI